MQFSSLYCLGGIYWDTLRIYVAKATVSSTIFLLPFPPPNLPVYDLIPYLVITCMRGAYLVLYTTTRYYAIMGYV